METGTKDQRRTGRAIGKGVVLFSAVASVLAGCTSGGSSEKSNAATLPVQPSGTSSSATNHIPSSAPSTPAPSTPAPSTTPAPPSHTPVAPGSSTGGPSINPPAYILSAPAGGAPQWQALGTGSEITGDSSGFAVRFDPKTVRFELHAGSQVPGGSGWPGGDAASTKGLVAGWNGGFLMANGASWGGFFLGGRIVFGPLKTNTASEVFYNDGTMDVLAWPGGLPGPDVAGVRQNLALMIDNGNLASDLSAGTAADEHTWGFTNDSSNEHGNRSGIGVTADGQVVYAAVKGASPLQLAQFMQRAGAVRAMQLDINYSRPIFGTFVGGRWSQPASWMGAASQFTLGDQRDFVAVYSR